MKGESFLREAAVLAAEEQVSLRGGLPDTQAAQTGEMTEEELQWLSIWYDEQLQPDEVTLEQATAALATHRASSGGSSATQHLFDTQVCAHGCTLSHGCTGHLHALVRRLSPRFHACLRVCVARVEPCAQTARAFD